MKQLRYFVLGICSVMFLVPISKKLVELLDLWIDVLKTKPEVKLLNHKINIQSKKEFLKPTPYVCDLDDFYDDFEDLDDEYDD